MQCSICNQNQQFTSSDTMCDECIDSIDKSNNYFNIYVIECEDKSNDYFNIYVIECEDKSSEYKYYIGKTTNDVSIRFNQHKSSDNTCAWTNKYKPIKIVETYKTKDQLDEDKTTKKYMMKYGINRVRGGSYTKIVLDDWMIKSLEHEFTSAQDNCYNCNEKGHLYRYCDYKECPLDKKLNIQKYLEEFIDTNIDMEINKLEIIYEQIIILNHKINCSSDRFDINKYKKIITDIKELDSIILSIQQKMQDIEKSPDNEPITRNRGYSSNKRSLLNAKHTEKQKLETEKNSLFSQLTNFNDINYYYGQLFINDKIYLESQANQIIKLYKLRAFNLEKKKELKELLNIHTSEELIKMKLEGLYEKKISILSN
uniref:CCHC-type domain-containing protein n=1 Tax=viral metagenome TaxID=1070528 RepID=A0A6C0HVQ8_9ZZZZ